MPDFVTQAEFARIMKVSRSTVTRTWKQAGRLVMVGDLVDVAASRERIAQTNGGRDDVTARHAREREGERETPTPEEKRAQESRAAAQARKESALADLAEMEYRQKIGAVLPREDVEQSMADLVAFVRSGVENLPHRIAAQLVGKDHGAIMAILKQEVIEMMGGMHREAKKQLAAMVPGGEA